MKKSEIRKDYLLNKYVIITPGRIKRPRDIKEQTIIKRSEKCYFCPEQVARQNKDMRGKYIVDKIIRPQENSWQTVSVQNIFPAVSVNNKKAYGVQEVIIETADHNKELADLGEAQIQQVLQMYARRTRELAKNKKINYVLCFKNQGAKAGASKVHAHSQVFAAEIIPPKLREESSIVQSYKIKQGRCSYCDIIKKEMKSPRRIFEDNYIAAFAPYASEYHYEAWIFSKRHLDNIALFTPAEFKSLAKILKKILVKIQSLNLSFNYFLHNVVKDKKQHFYIKIQPRDSVWAGVELGSDIVINSLPPEEAAKYYRK